MEKNDKKLGKEVFGFCLIGDDRADVVWRKLFNDQSEVKRSLSWGNSVKLLMHVFKHSEDTNAIFQCYAEGKIWSYVPFLNFQVDG